MIRLFRKRKRPEPHPLRAEVGGPVLIGHGRGDYPAMQVERCAETGDLLFDVTMPPGYHARSAGITRPNVVRIRGSVADPAP